MHILFQCLYKLHEISAIMQVTLMNSLWLRQQIESCFSSVIQRIDSTDRMMLCRKFNILISLCCTPNIEKYPDSRGLMKKC